MTQDKIRIFLTVLIATISGDTLNFLHAQSLHQANWTQDDFAALRERAQEELEFGMRYNGLETAKATLMASFSRNGEQAHLQWHVRTRPFYDLLFPIDNLYESWLDVTSGQLIRSRKRIEQKNIRQSLDITYNAEKNVAFSDQNISWPSCANRLDLLTLLFFLRTRSMHTGDSLVINLDIESQLWQATGRVERADERSMAQLGADQTITFKLKPLAEMTPRSWKTDLLTHRISRSSSRVTVFRRTMPRVDLVLLQFGTPGSSVEMRLKKVKRGSK